MDRCANSVESYEATMYGNFNPTLVRSKCKSVSSTLQCHLTCVLLNFIIHVVALLYPIC